MKQLVMKFFLLSVTSSFLRYFPHHSVFPSLLLCVIPLGLGQSFISRQNSCKAILHKVNYN